MYGNPSLVSAASAATGTGLAESGAHLLGIVVLAVGVLFGLMSLFAVARRRRHLHP